MWSEEVESEKNLNKFKGDYFHLYPYEKVNLNSFFKADILKIFFPRPHLCQLFHL